MHSTSSTPFCEASIFGFQENFAIILKEAPMEYLLLLKTEAIREGVSTLTNVSWREE